jgi:hypothetical protein
MQWHFLKIISKKIQHQVPAKRIPTKTKKDGKFFF